MGKFYNKKINDVWNRLDDESKEAMLLFGKQCADAAITGYKRGQKLGFKRGVTAVCVTAAVGRMVYEWWKTRNEIPVENDIVTEEAE